MDARLRLYDAASQLSEFGAWACEIDTEKLTWTSGVYALFDLPLDAPLRRAELAAHYVEDCRREMEWARGEVISSGKGVALESRIRTARGNTKWIRLCIDIDRHDGYPVRLFGSKQDITRHKAELDQLRRRAEHDPLTGLLNRGMFEAHYRAVVADQLNYGAVAAFVLIDLNLFKQINDRFGHAAGDECLRQVGARLLRAAGLTASVFRIGGDEFAVFLPAPLNHATIVKVLARISRATSKSLVWNGARVEIGVSIGATIIDRPHRRKLSELFAEADAALYQAKGAGLNNVRIFGDPDEDV